MRKSELENKRTKAVAEATTMRKGRNYLPSFFERLVIQVLSTAKEGSLRICLPDGSSYWLGNKQDESRALLQVKDRHFFLHLLLFGEVGFGESYMSKMWDSPDLFSLLQWFVRNSAHLPTFSDTLSPRHLLLAPLALLYRLQQFLRPNSKRLAKRNISSHYDLSNQFFRLWLDRSMTYSSAIFDQADQNLYEAQQNKYDAICRKLQLKPEDHVLEIGCGWGGFAIYAARNYNCRVSALTISEQQWKYAKERVKEEGLEGQVEILLQDYRDTKGLFNKIASIEMIEALGLRYLDIFFSQCNRLLKPDGIVVIQCITFPDPYYRRYLRNTDFTRKHIFPGSLLLSQQEILASLQRSGNLCLYDLESIGEHYALTLRRWHENFIKNEEQIRELGFDSAFMRKWGYYLKFCEVGFTNHYINDIQIVLSRPLNSSRFNRLGRFA